MLSLAHTGEEETLGKREETLRDSGRDMEGEEENTGREEGNMESEVDSAEGKENTDRYASAIYSDL